MSVLEAGTPHRLGAREPPPAAQQVQTQAQVSPPRPATAAEQVWLEEALMRMLVQSLQVDVLSRAEDFETNQCSRCDAVASPVVREPRAGAGRGLEPNGRCDKSRRRIPRR